MYIRINNQNKHQNKQQKYFVGIKELCNVLSHVSQCLSGSIDDTPRSYFSVI